MHRKAQIWSTDFTASIVVFLSVVAVFIFAWGYISTEMQNSVVILNAERDALALSDSLIRISGEPDDWDAGNVEVIGLADEEHVLNSTKLVRFASIGYGKAKALMGIGDYGFHFSVLTPNGTSVFSTGLYPQNASVVVPVDRYVLYENRPARARLILWV
ncbi:MAG: hypothetical protein DRO99_04875 [Candidatus Aenigmatarchaeota archaeon]|nr:MAG: hypothetical protein DRO99_04875 [Candidatus Aenigmarchaeota archaeon]